MNVSSELQCLEELRQSGFIQEEEYERRKQILNAHRVGDVEALIQQSASATSFSDTAAPSEPISKKTLVTMLQTPAETPAPTWPTIKSTPPPAPKAPQFKNEVNPFVYTEDYSKIKEPIVFVSKVGWTKERDNRGAPDEPTDELIAHWKSLQRQYASAVSTSDTFEWTTDIGKPNTLKLIGGLDISFPKGGNKIDAVVCLAVCTYPDNKLVFVAYKMVKLKAPYVAGLLNFRESPHYVATLQEVKAKYPQFMPQVLILDGNGVIHPRACGIACQLGVLTGIPSFGVAKKLLVFDGLDVETIAGSFRSPTQRWADIRGDSGKLHGRAFRFDATCEPVFVSSGHKVSLDTAQIITERTAISREPEAVNQSDLLGREWLNKNYRTL